MDEIKLKKGMELDLTIEGLALGGKGFARKNNYMIFVDRAIPGQTVRVFLRKVKKNYAEARVLEVMEDAKDAFPPRCSHFGECGGCLLQNLDYKKQIQYKRAQVTETLQHIGGFTDLEAEPVLPSPDIYFYRNKMEYSFSRMRWLTKEEIETNNIQANKDFALGLHVPGRHDKVLDVESCYLLSEESNRILRDVNDWARESGIAPYSTVDHSGYWRFLVLRRGVFTSEFMINLVTAHDEKKHESVEQLKDFLISKYPGITTFVHNINKKKAQIAVGDEERILHGKGFITEKLGDLIFHISANSFFQTNSRQTVHLYDKVLEIGDFSTQDIVYDLYSGTGSIAMYLSKKVNRIVGIELVQAAIRDAEKNCELNEIENCTFIRGDLKDVIADSNALVSEYGAPDKVIIDPPRSGMHPSIPGAVMALKPERIVYVSCNPATFARDAKELCDNDYSLQRVHPVDMFPHTPHIEVVALLTRK